MVVRGAPLIGATAAYGLALALRAMPSDAALERAYRALLPSRPTAVNLRHALDDVRAIVAPLAAARRARRRLARAGEICDEDVALCQRIGEAGLPLIEALHRARRRGRSTFSPIATPAGSPPSTGARRRRRSTWRTIAGVPVHVWVDETRPRNQGAALTAFELGQHGVPHTVIVDNAGGHLMQHGRVDLVHRRRRPHHRARATPPTRSAPISRRSPRATTACRSTSPLPHTTIDWTIRDGLSEIEIEERDAERGHAYAGRLDDGAIARVALTPPGSPALNPAFDVTPAELVTALITDRGVCAATGEGLAALFPGRAAASAGSVEPAWVGRRLPACVAIRAAKAWPPPAAAAPGPWRRSPRSARWRRSSPWR